VRVHGASTSMRATSAEEDGILVQGTIYPDTHRSGGHGNATYQEHIQISSAGIQRLM